MSESFYSSDAPMGVSCPSHVHPLLALMGLSPHSIPQSHSIFQSPITTGPPAHGMAFLEDAGEQIKEMQKEE